MLIIGIGNPYRRDDGAGIVVAERLEGTPGLEVIAHHGEGLELMRLWEGHDDVVLVDAVSSKAEAGTIHRLDAAAGPLLAKLFCHSSHAFGVAQAVELARQLGTLPARLRIIGIEAGDWSAGQGLTPPVAAAVDAVVAELTPSGSGTGG